MDLSDWVMTGFKSYVRTFKDISAIELFKAFPQLIQFYAGCGILWSREYFVSTVIKIKEHKNDN